MSKKKVILTVSAVFLIIAVVLIWRNSKEYVFLPSDKIYFKMSENALVNLEGEPESREENVGDTPLFSCDYTEETDEYLLSKSYCFFPTWYGSALCDVGWSYKLKNPDRVEEFFNELYEKIDGYYKNRSGYYNDGKTFPDYDYMYYDSADGEYTEALNDKNYYISLGRKLSGATYISISIGIENDVVYLNAHYIE